MQLHEITDIYLGDRLYETLMVNDELLDEGAKELFAAGKQKMGQAAEKLKDAVDAPAQKAWAEVQSRLATAGKDDAIGKLKAFASKHKVAIGTMAIIGMGLLTSTDASAGDAVQAAGAAGNFGGGGDILQDVLSNIQQMGQQQGMDLSNIGDNLQGIKVKGIPIQDYAEKATQAIQNAVGSSKADMQQAASDNIQRAIIDAVKASGSAQQTTDAAQGASQAIPNGGSQFTGQDGRKVNFGKSVSNTIKAAMGKG